MTASTTFIKRSLDKTISEVFENVAPVGLRREMVIKNSRIPIITGGEDVMRKAVPFVLGVWLHLEVRKAVDDVERNDATIISANTLRDPPTFIERSSTLLRCALN